VHGFFRVFFNFVGFKHWDVSKVAVWFDFADQRPVATVSCESLLGVLEVSDMTSDVVFSDLFCLSVVCFVQIDLC
jgi:hypothetical protein